jgi:hypothetical protein
MNKEKEVDSAMQELDELRASIKECNEVRTRLFARRLEVWLLLHESGVSQSMIAFLSGVGRADVCNALKPWRKN